MRFYYSPQKLIEIVKNSSAITKELKTDPYNHDNEWYFSKDGKAAYNNAKTVAQKAKYFFDYLYTVVKETLNDSAEEIKQNKIILHKLAYVMANSMDNSSLEFAGYPNIIDPHKNRLIEITKKFLHNPKELEYIRCISMLRKSRYDSEDTKIMPLNDKEALLGMMFLAALNKKDDADLIYDRYYPYTQISFCKNNDKFTEMYKIERDIIGAFCKNFSDTKVMPPYIYNSVYSDERLASVQEFIENNIGYVMDPGFYKIYDDLYRYGPDYVGEDDEDDYED